MPPLLWMVGAPPFQLAGGSSFSPSMMLAGCTETGTPIALSWVTFVVSAKDSACRPEPGPSITPMWLNSFV